MRPAVLAGACAISKPPATPGILLAAKTIARLHGSIGVRAVGTVVHPAGNRFTNSQHIIE